MKDVATVQFAKFHSFFHIEVENTNYKYKNTKYKLRNILCTFKKGGVGFEKFENTLQLNVLWDKWQSHLRYSCHDLTLGQDWITLPLSLVIQSTQHSSVYFKVVITTLII